MGAQLMEVRERGTSMRKLESVRNLESEGQLWEI